MPKTDPVGDFGTLIPNFSNLGLVSIKGVRKGVSPSQFADAVANYGTDLFLITTKKLSQQPKNQNQTQQTLYEARSKSFLEVRGATIRNPSVRNALLSWL